MSQPAMLAVMIVLGVLAGIGMVVLLQIWRTFRAAEEILSATRPRVEEALERIASTTERVSRLSAEAEAGLSEMRSMILRVDGIAQNVDRLRESLGRVATVGAAVGPAFAAGIRAMFADGNGEAEPEIPTTQRQEVNR